MTNKIKLMKLDSQALQPDTKTWLNSRPEMTEADPLVGQKRAVTALDSALRQNGPFANVYALFPPGLLKRDLLDAYFNQTQWSAAESFDWVYFVNPDDPVRPLCVNLPLGKASHAITAIWQFLQRPLDQRQNAFDAIINEYGTAKLNRYMERLHDKKAEDITGETLARILVTHESPAAYYYCDRVSEQRLFGTIGIQSVDGTVSSDLHLIEPGLVHQANGSVLAIDVTHLLDDVGLWIRLKHIVASGEFEWPFPDSSSKTPYYRPESIPVNLKVVLLGSRDEYAQLREYDEDFDHFFPFLADFQGHYATQNEAAAPYFNYLAYVWRLAEVMPLSADGYEALLKVCARYTDYQQELTFHTVRLLQLLKEAHDCARLGDTSEITHTAIERALQQQRDRESNLAELSRRSILEQQVRIDTQGLAIGQLNGLTVVTMGGSEFGEPSRITATVHYGDGDIIDIERKSDLSGNIHTKGVMILSAYLANQFARHEPLSVSATVVFEQSYYEVDGDSASLGELCCLISALAEQPLKQSLAITGAIDQFGNVQSIGAVNEKIEGYYALCEQRGLNGEQGVIIPKSNTHQLNVSHDVLQAVKDGNFHVYTVEHVEEALELLTGLPIKTLFDQVRSQTRDGVDDDQPVGLLRRIFR